MRFLLFISIIFFSLSSSAQEFVNPFEIQSRLDSVYSEGEKEVSTTENIFDIEGRKKETIENPEILQPQNEEEVEVESSIIPQVGEEIIIEEAKSPEGDNPFDVSHIPLRKSKLKKEANAFDGKKTETKKDTQSNAFLFWLILLTSLLLAIVINTQRGAITKISKAITNENVLKLNQREEKRGINGHYTLLYVAFIINAAIFLYLIVNNFVGLSGWQVFQKSLLAVFLVYAFRHLFLFMVSKSFPIEKEAALYSFTIQTFNMFIGIVLIPVNLIIAFGPEKMVSILIYVSLFFIGLAYLLRNLRGILIASKYISGNLFHFLLYLCTFEILPILLLIKIIGNFGNA